ASRPSTIEGWALSASMRTASRLLGLFMAFGVPKGVAEHKPMPQEWHRARAWKEIRDALHSLPEVSRQNAASHGGGLTAARGQLVDPSVAGFPFASSRRLVWPRTPVAESGLFRQTVIPRWREARTAPRVQHLLPEYPVGRRYAGHQHIRAHLADVDVLLQDFAPSLCVQHGNPQGFKPDPV